MDMICSCNGISGIYSWNDHLVLGNGSKKKNKKSLYPEVAAGISELVSWVTRCDRVSLVCICSGRLSLSHSSSSDWIPLTARTAEHTKYTAITGSLRGYRKWGIHFLFPKTFVLVSSYTYEFAMIPFFAPRKWDGWKRAKSYSNGFSSHRNCSSLEQ